MITRIQLVGFETRMWWLEEGSHHFIPIQGGDGALYPSALRATQKSGSALPRLEEEISIYPLRSASRPARSMLPLEREKTVGRVEESWMEPTLGLKEVSALNCVIRYQRPMLLRLRRVSKPWR